MRAFAPFAGRIVVAFVVTAFVVGVFSYEFLTKPLFEDPQSVLRSVYRTPADPELWRQATIWAFPVQALRSFLYAVVLFPFFPTLAEWSLARRFIALSGLFVVLSVFASDGGILESLYISRSPSSGESSSRLGWRGGRSRGGSWTGPPNKRMQLTKPAQATELRS